MLTVLWEVYYDCFPSCQACHFSMVNNFLIWLVFFIPWATCSHAFQWSLWTVFLTVNPVRWCICSISPLPPAFLLEPTILLVGVGSLWDCSVSISACWQGMRWDPDSWRRRRDLTGSFYLVLSFSAQHPTAALCCSQGLWTWHFSHSVFPGDEPRYSWRMRGQVKQGFVSQIRLLLLFSLVFSGPHFSLRN